jgi:hypothetical protein
MRRNHYEKHKHKIIKQVRNRKEELHEWVDSLKKGQLCLDCGRTDIPFLMDYDHLDNKEFSISFAWMNGYSKERILEEIAKCELVCCRCHRIRTHARFNAPLV